MKQIDKKALNRWNKSEISYVNYSKFILTKSNKFKLTFIDLLYVSNFKGGYATINEPEEIISKKLIPYGQLLEEINLKFDNKTLKNLNDRELAELIDFSDKLINLTDPKGESKIDGFSVSFLTALLHFHFPNLYPILDRRVLNGLDLIEESDLDSQRQVKKLKNFYPKLILKFKDLTEDKSIRNIDRELFIRKL